jgi:hypothetical protein
MKLFCGDIRSSLLQGKKIVDILDEIPTVQNKEVDSFGHGARYSYSIFEANKIKGPFWDFWE